MSAIIKVANRYTHATNKCYLITNRFMTCTSDLCDNSTFFCTLSFLLGMNIMCDCDVPVSLHWGNITCLTYICNQHQLKCKISISPWFANLLHCWQLYKYFYYGYSSPNTARLLTHCYICFGLLIFHSNRFLSVTSSTISLKKTNILHS